MTAFFKRLDWSSSKLLSFQITYHIIRLGVHLLMYRHDFVFIRAYIGYLAVTTTPPVDPTVSWRGVMLMALVLIRLLSVPSHSSIGGLQLKISEQTFNPVLPSSVPSCYHNLQIMTQYNNFLTLVNWLNMKLVDTSDGFRVLKSGIG